MKAARIHLLLDPEDKEKIEKQASMEGVSMGEWIRKAVKIRLNEDSQEAQLEDIRNQIRALTGAMARNGVEIG